MRIRLYLVLAAAVASLQAFPAAAAPAGCHGKEYRAFDFAVGTWTAHNMKGEVNGKADNTKALSGCSIRMHWTGRTYEGTNNNAYDDSRGIWQKAWFDNTGGVELSTGTFVNGSLVYTGVDYDKGVAVEMHRETWSLLPDGRMRERYEISKDRGKTWEVSFTTHYTRVDRKTYDAQKVSQDR